MIEKNARKINTSFLLIVAIISIFKKSTATPLNHLTMIDGAFFGGLSVTGAGEVPFVPKGSPIPGSVGSIVRHITLGKRGVQNFGDNSECLNTSVSAAAGGNVCQYVWVESTAAAGQNWAQSLGLTLDPGYGQYTSVVSELDINNLAGDREEFGPRGNNVGILLNGLKYMNTAGMSIQTGNMTKGVTGSNGRLPIWFHGIHIGVNATLNDDFESQSNAVYGVRMHGAHAFAVHLADDNSSEGAIALGSLGPAQGIVARNQNRYYPVLYMSTDGHIHVGNITQAIVISDGNINPVTDNTYSLGTATRTWHNIHVRSINNVPMVKAGKPSIGAACTPGAQQFDSNKFYMCLTDNRWHTMAMATD
ncbi:hypothetical protein AAC691_05145 [Nguyenibacter vanlangensis]|uniref:Uncharacterized protein n=1 Tax=Nguyenibacter vanlangensis TaxID=1216886 RepID=A0ABZ3D8B8_9PROT